MPASRSAVAEGHSRRIARNADEVRLAEHLIASAANRLAGRDGAGQELVGVRPRERVVLGVLLPQPRPVLVPPASASPVPFEPGVPVDHLPASEMGLSALIDANATEIRLHVRSSFALYLQHTPTHEQQRSHSGLTSVPDDAPPIDDQPSD